jgi:hypothetical protein
LATIYKVLGQVTPTSASVTITNKVLTNGVATLTTSTAHGFVLNQPVQINLVAADANFDGIRTITSAPTSTTFTFSNVGVSNVASAGTSAGSLAVGAVWTNLYACPANDTSAIVSTLSVTNRGDVAAYYGVAISSASVGVAPDASIITTGDIAAGRETIFLTGGLIADSYSGKRFIRVAATNNNFTFQAFGSEISPS